MVIMMRNATCVDTTISIEWPHSSYIYGSFLYCVKSNMAVNAKFQDLASSNQIVSNFVFLQVFLFPYQDCLC